MLGRQSSQQVLPGSHLATDESIPKHRLKVGGSRGVIRNTAQPGSHAKAVAQMTTKADATSHPDIPLTVSFYTALFAGGSKPATTFVRARVSKRQHYQH